MDEFQMKQIEAMNKILLDTTKNQREANKNLLRVFIVTIICFTILLVTMIIGFFWYESQFETEYTTTTETITQEVSGEDSTINNVEGNQYNDDAVHNE